MHRLESHLRRAISALIFAQAEAEDLGLDGLDHDLFLIRLELQRAAQNPRKYGPRLADQMTVDDFLSDPKA